MMRSPSNSLVAAALLVLCNVVCAENEYFDSTRYGSSSQSADARALLARQQRMEQQAREAAVAEGSRITFKISDLHFNPGNVDGFLTFYSACQIIRETAAGKGGRPGNPVNVMLMGDILNWDAGLEKTPGELEKKLDALGEQVKTRGGEGAYEFFKRWRERYNSDANTQTVETALNAQTVTPAFAKSRDNWARFGRMQMAFADMLTEQLPKRPGNEGAQHRVFHLSGNHDQHYNDTTKAAQYAWDAQRNHSALFSLLKMTGEADFRGEIAAEALPDAESMNRHMETQIRRLQESPGELRTALATGMAEQLKGLLEKASQFGDLATRAGISENARTRVMGLLEKVINAPESNKPLEALVLLQDPAFVRLLVLAEAAGESLNRISALTSQANALRESLRKELPAEMHYLLEPVGPGKTLQLRNPEHLEVLKTALGKIASADRSAVGNAISAVQRVVDHRHVENSKFFVREHMIKLLGSDPIMKLGAYPYEAKLGPDGEAVAKFLNSVRTRVCAGGACHVVLTDSPEEIGLVSRNGNEYVTGKQRVQPGFDAKTALKNQSAEAYVHYPLPEGEFVKHSRDLFYSLKKTTGKTEPLPSYVVMLNHGDDHQRSRVIGIHQGVGKDMPLKLFGVLDTGAAGSWIRSDGQGYTLVMEVNGLNFHLNLDPNGKGRAADSLLTPTQTNTGLPIDPEKPPEGLLPRLYKGILQQTRPSHLPSKCLQDYELISGAASVF